MAALDTHINTHTKRGTWWSTDLSFSAVKLNYNKLYRNSQTLLSRTKNYFPLICRLVFSLFSLVFSLTWLHVQGVNPLISNTLVSKLITLLRRRCILVWVNAFLQGSWIKHALDTSQTCSYSYSCSHGQSQEMHWILKCFISGICVACWSFCRQDYGKTTGQIIYKGVRTV